MSPPMRKNHDPLADLIRNVWPRLNPAQRVFLLLQVFGYDLWNRFERIEVRALAALAFLLNFFFLHESIPDHPLKPFFTLATAFYSAALLLMVATWPPRKKTRHWVK